MATIPGANRKVLKEGIIQKRQRGKRVKGQDFSGLKFQTRFLCLDAESLRYYQVNRKEKTFRGKFPVSSVAFVEKIPPNTFTGVKYGFQIGNEDEVMYFGAQNEEDRIQWMEAIRMGARLSTNVMASYYHPGAFGKSVPGQWSCCEKKGKKTEGCEMTGIGFRGRAQSEFTYDVTENEEDTDIFSDEDEDNEEMSPTDVWENKSVLSEDSGCPRNNMYGSKSSLLSSDCDGAIQKDSTDEQEDDYKEEISEMLAKHNYDLLAVKRISADSSINALDFRGADTLVAGGSNGKVYVMDVTRCGVFSEDFSEVTSLETWRSLVLICTKTGVWLQDLDNTEIKFQLSNELDTISINFSENYFLLPLKQYFAGFSPDGSRIVMTWANMMEVQKIKTPQNSDIESMFTQKLPGSTVLLSVSPNPKLSKAVVGTARNNRLILCICDYMKEGFDEVDIGTFNSSNSVQAHFQPSQPKLAVGHGKSLTMLDITKQESCVFNTERKITALQFSPTGDDLVVGMDGGSVLVLDGKAAEFSLRHTLSFPQNHMSITFSKDSSLLVLGDNNGRLKLITRPFATKRKREPKIPNITISIPVKGYTLRLEEHDITVVFPPGFIEQESLSFEYRVITHTNPQNFKDGIRPVSVILLLNPMQKMEFLKPIEVTMPHFVDLETESDCERLMFCVGRSNSQSKGLNFEGVSENQPITLFTKGPYKERIQYATLYTKHCCYFCIGELTKADTDKARIVLTRAVSKPVTDSSSEVFVHLCFYYKLPSCRKLVEMQFPEDSYETKSYVVRFDSPSNGVEIQVRNFDELKDKGWDYYFENGTEENKIYMKDINFWDIPSQSQLESMCNDKIYPPRFILGVMGSQSSKDVPLKLALPGLLYEVPEAMPLLTIPLKRNSSKKKSAEYIHSPSLVAPRSISKQSIHSIRRQGGNRFVISALKSCIFAICKDTFETVDLALKLYSKNVITSEQLDPLIGSLGEKGQDSLRKIQNYNLLRIVEDNILKDPGKFFVLCEAFEELNLDWCSQDLKAALHERRMASTSTISGSEENLIVQRRERNSSTACEESDGLTPRQSQNLDSTGIYVPQHSNSDPIPFNAAAGKED